MLLHWYLLFVLTIHYRAILHNDKMYPDPFTFQPERFLKDGKLNFDSVLDPELAAFGFGRRIW